MPILKVIHEEPCYIAGGGKYHDDAAVESVISYILNPAKTRNNFVGGRGVNVSYAAYEMNRMAEAFDKESGIRVRHMVLSFSQKEERRLGRTRYDVAVIPVQGDVSRQHPMGCGGIQCDLWSGPYSESRQRKWNELG